MGAEDGSIENGPERKEDAVDEVAVANASESEDPHETLLRTGVEGETSISSLDADDTAVLKAGWELPPDSNETMGSNALRTITASDDWLGEEIRKKETLRKRLQRLCAVFGWLIFIFLGAWAVFYVVFMVFVSKVDNLDADDWGYSFEKNAPPEVEIFASYKLGLGLRGRDTFCSGAKAFMDSSFTTISGIVCLSLRCDLVGKSGRGKFRMCIDSAKSDQHFGFRFTRTGVERLCRPQQSC
mmetsp:Transcript_5244/g.22318  ORF Transcript_5244/g.22318 Transcript_5244/m.22318 type:complete len:241 (-) Transcript_5244:1240-1962(-)